MSGRGGKIRHSRKSGTVIWNDLSKMMHGDKAKDPRGEGTPEPKPLHNPHSDDLVQRYKQLRDKATHEEIDETEKNPTSPHHR